MTRLTRIKDEYECRIGNCLAEDWIENITGEVAFNWPGDVCKDCPFEKYINRLAEYEDKEEKYERSKKIM